MGLKFLVCLAAFAFVASVAANDRDAVAARQTNKAGTCPVAGVGRCTKECENDGGCTGDKKCCRTSCGGKYCHSPGSSDHGHGSGHGVTTVAPNAQRGSQGTKPGYCVPSINQLVCAQACQRDADCRGANKCCKTTCDGKVCSEPMTSPPPTPPPSGGSNTPKPGQCTPNLAQFSCSSECQKDSDCRYDLKCCRTTCGGRMCSAPTNGRTTTTSTTTRRPNANSRPGECPAATPRAGGVAGCPETCRRDNDCRSNHKCCSNSCGGKDCTAPVINQG